MMSIFMRQKWDDPRLSYSHLSDEDMITLDSRFADSIWLPGLRIFVFVTITLFSKRSAYENHPTFLRSLGQ